jgi:hypothetical protein
MRFPSVQPRPSQTALTHLRQSASPEASSVAVSLSIVLAEARKRGGQAGARSSLVEAAFAGSDAGSGSSDAEAAAL